MRKGIAPILAAWVCLSLCACGTGGLQGEGRESEADVSTGEASFPEDADASGEAAPDGLERGDADEIRPEFREALDGYGAFFDEYCTFMQMYAADPTDPELLAGYAQFMGRYADAMAGMETLDDGEMNDAEMRYYIEVTSRISQKLLEASAGAG